MYECMNCDECMNHDDIVIPGLREFNPEIPGLKIVLGLESLAVTVGQCIIKHTT